MKKIFTIAAAILFAGSMMAETETITKSSDNWDGVSIALTNAECANGSKDAKKDGDTENVTYIKFRTNKNGNTITLNVKDGYKVTGLYLRGFTNDGSASATMQSVKYDNNAAITTNLVFPNSEAGTTVTYENNTDEATTAIVLQFDNSGKQLMAVITVTYEALAPVTDPVASVVVAGPTECFVGQKVSYTATTDVKANAYKWMVNGTEVEGATAAEYEFTPDAVGTYTVACSAKNDNNTDFVASNIISLVASERADVEQVIVTDHTTWDFSKAATVSQIKWEGDQKDAAPVVMANIDGMNNDANFNSQALLFSGEYPIRDGKYCQGPHLEFAINAPGKLTIEYSNTGNRSAAEGETEGQEALRRFLTINGNLVPGDAGSMKSNVNTTTENIAVEPGNVVISGAMPYSETPTAAQYIRIYKVVYQRTGWPTAIDNNEVELKAVKRIVNGQLLIEKNGVMYNAQGVVVK